MLQILSLIELYFESNKSFSEHNLNFAELKNDSITLKLNLSLLSIENRISLNITSPVNFLTWKSTFVSTAKSSKVFAGISLSNSSTVIIQNYDLILISFISFYFITNIHLLEVSNTYGGTLAPAEDVDEARIKNI